jgi:ATP-binding protein involved in chromosome partitioning
MVKDIRIDGAKVALRVVLTTPACPVRATIEPEVEDAVRGIPGVQDVDVDFDAQVLAARPAGPKPVAGVKNIIAVASNKGGVGKSTVAVNLAVALAQSGAAVGLLDADITGPNVPTMLGLEQGFLASNNQGLASIDRFGVKATSLGFLLPKNGAVIWRGPMIGSAVRQLLHDIAWGELDYLVIDLPPGTSDAAMSMAQEASIAGVVIVCTPQEVAVEDALKAVTMFEKLNVPVFGVVENMSYFVCPDCNSRHEIFGHGGARKAAEEHELDFLGEIPLHPGIRVGSDIGAPVTATDPDSPQAQAFREVAGKVAAKLSILARISVGVR